MSFPQEKRVRYTKRK